MNRVVSILFILLGCLVARAANPAMPVIPATVFNITDYGAVGDGVTDNTTNIQNTINAANAAGGGMVEIPSGVFMSGPFTLLSSINLHLDSGAILRMLPLGVYPGGITNANHMITCNNIHDDEISGQGTFDGQGAPWWAYNVQTNTIVRPMILNLTSVNRLFIHDVTYMNPPNHHCGLRGNGGNITISNLTVNTDPNSPNTDGLNFVATNSIIENCHISDGDDNIAMGSTGPMNDLLVTNCFFGFGHGVSFGSGISGVTNFTLINSTFSGTGNGLRIKCARDNSQPMKNINYLNLGMTNVGIPIVFYSYYDEVGGPTSIRMTQVLAATNTLPINASTPWWRDITISNLTATGTSIGGILWGPTEQPISNLTLIHVTITAPRTFDIYNAKDIKIIDSQFNFTSGPTFTLCNAGVIISNSLPGAKAVSLDGTNSANVLELYNADAFLTSTDAFNISPFTLSASLVTNTGNLSFSSARVLKFAVGTNAATIAVKGNLALNGTLHITNAPGFIATNYTLFTYTGTLSGSAVIGNKPPGYDCVLDTSTAGKVKVVTTFTGVSTSATTNTLQASTNTITFGAPVTFTATVTPTPTNGELITFKDGIVTLGTGALASGVAGFTASNQLAVGVHSITAFYPGDGAYGSSTSAALFETVNQTNPPTGIVFSDTFGTSTVDSTPGVPGPTSTAYEVLAGKSWSPAPTLLPGRLTFGIGATSSGVIEVQAQFAATPVSLSTPGDFVQLTVTFTNTAGILTQTGFWGFGLYNSAGSPPVAGGLNNALNGTATTAATGAAQNWQGYFAQIGFTGANSAFYDRKKQSGAVNNNQDLVSTGTSSSYANPAAGLIGSASATPSVTLTAGGTYTEVLTYTLAPDGTLQLQHQLFNGTGTNGTLLSTMSATTSAAPLTNSFDALAIGWRATGSAISTMTISSITVTGQSTPLQHVLQLTTSGALLTLTWPASDLGWLLQSNVDLLSTDWSTVLGSDSTTNFSITIDPSQPNVFYRLVSP